MKLPVQVTGVGPFKYQFIFSADASLFNLNETTGELTNKNTFDFEKPQSEKGTNQYTLSLLVTDANKYSAIQDIVIDVQNVDEYELVVDFPIDGANMGMGAEKVRVRGHITESGKTLAQIPAALSVSVNGVAAVVDPAAPSRWMAEVPLVAGDNPLAVTLASAGKIARETSVNLLNRPVDASRIADGQHDYYLAADYTGTKIFKRSFVNGGDYSLLVSNEEEAFAGCKSFNQLSLSASGAKMSAICLGNSGPADKLVVCDIAEKTCGVKGFVDRSVEALKWVDDRYIIYTSGTRSFGLLDTQTATFKTLVMEAPLEFAWSVDMAINGTEVLVKLASIDVGGYRREDAYLFNLKSFIEAQAETQTLVPTIVPELAYRTFPTAFFADTYYMLENDGFSYLRRDASSAGLEKVSLLTTATNYKPTVVHVANGVVVFLQEGAMFSYNLATHEPKELDAKKRVYDWVETDLSPDSKQFAVYEPLSRRFALYDVNTGAVSEVAKLPRPPANDYDLFGSIAVDWQNNIMYRTNNAGWGGIEPDFTALFTAYNLKTKAYTTVATASDIASQIGGSFKRLSPRRMVYKADTQDLIFHLNIYIEVKDPTTLQTTTTTRQLICALNVNTRQVRTLRVFEGEGKFAEIFMSRFNPATNGVAFGHWGDDRNLGGGLEWFDFSGGFTRLLEPQMPYHLTPRGVLNPSGDHYYGFGFKRVEGESYADYANFEIFNLDLATKERKVFASKALGNGLAVPWLEPVYEANRDVLIDFNSYHLWFVDALTGDRVVKTLSIP
ncbi:MAG: cadherin repeat domain-containing protein [Marinagarivorans sp.]